MLQSKRLDFAAWGASFLFAFAPLVHADDDIPPAPPARSATLDPVPQQTPVERWQRLKSQYATPSGAPAMRRVNAPATVTGNPASADDAGTFKVIPSTTGGSAGSGKTSTVVPIWQSNGPTSANSAISTESPRAGISTSPVGMKKEGMTAEEILSLPDDVSPQDFSGLPSPDDSVRPSEPSDQSPDGSLRGMPRPAGPGDIPSGPPRKATQVRPIGAIAPLNDFDRDRDIRTFAAEKAREFNVRFGGDQYIPRNFPDVAMQWEPPQAYYYPLYFQDPVLERYGHKYPFPIQPIVSNARFAAQFLLMPYQMAITPPWEMHTALGWYRPGDVTPRLHYQFPLSGKAALVEAATVTGFYFLIP